MGDLTNNFSRHEFACECGCGKGAVDYFLLTVLQDLRDHFNAEVTVSGGNRCWKHHIEVYKSLGKFPIKNSAHLISMAADIKVNGVSPRSVYKYLDKRWGDKVCLGLYYSFVHVDSRSFGYRWKGF